MLGWARTLPFSQLPKGKGGTRLERLRFQSKVFEVELKVAGFPVYGGKECKA